MYDPTWPVDLGGIIWLIFLVFYVYILQRIFRIPIHSFSDNFSPPIAMFSLLAYFLPYGLALIYEILSGVISWPVINGWDRLYFCIPSILMVAIVVIKEKRGSVKS